MRRLRGVERAEFHRRTGFELDALLGEPLAQMTALGLMEDDDTRVRLTREGLFVSDAIWPKFLRR